MLGGAAFDVENPAELERVIEMRRQAISSRVCNGLSGLGLRTSMGTEFGLPPAPGMSKESGTATGIFGNDVDGSLILSMERTVYASLNQAWMLVGCGVGFMSIGASNDSVPDHLGFLIILFALVFAVGSYLVHVLRLRAFARGDPLTGMVTVVWVGLLVAVIFITLLLELYYAVTYPYLTRAKAVELITPGSAQVTNSTTES